MTAAAPARRTGGSRRAGGRQEALAGYAFISIPMVLFLVLNVGTTLFAFFISLWDWNYRRGPEEFLGFANYQRILSDDLFWIAVRNSVYYAIVWVPLTMAIGLFLAVIVNQKIRGQTFFRAAFYFPAIASSAAITVLWIFLLQPDGLFNDVRAALMRVRAARVMGSDAGKVRSGAARRIDALAARLREPRTVAVSG